MDNNVIIPVNLMRPYTLYNIGHENNLYCLAVNVNAIAGAVFVFYRVQEQKERMKDFLIVSTYQLTISDIVHS